MDPQAYIVAALFGFIGGLLVPRTGPDRRALIVTLTLVAVVGTAVWLLSDDPFAGPSLTVGGVSGIVGSVVKLPGSASKSPRI
ncbi:MAG: hypothetical protein WD313_00980 [Acidimicrobiia bacterium]